MKKFGMIFLLLCGGHLSLNAQDPVTEVIKEGIKRAIRAVDLKIQRLQNETIWLQNAQKVVENTLSELKLQEIADWVERQRTLYADYFDELQQVKHVIAYYHRIRELTTLQIKMVEEYRAAIRLFRQDPHFTANEIRFMEAVYAGILEKSTEHLDRLQLVVNAFTVSMTDAQRLQVIDEAADQVEKNYADLRRFNQENRLLSLQRAKNAQEIDVVKKMYGL